MIFMLSFLDEPSQDCKHLSPSSSVGNTFFFIALQVYNNVHLINEWFVLWCQPSQCKTGYNLYFIKLTGLTSELL